VAEIGIDPDEGRGTITCYELPSRLEWECRFPAEGHG
jgi:hypothetical protein